jgi:AAA domain
MNERAGRRLRPRPLAAVEAKNVRWLVPGLIPLRTLTLVAGVGGLGKSTWLAARAADVSRGDLGGKPADVLIVTFEDAAEEVLRPRVEAAAGDLKRVHEVTVEGLEGIAPVLLPQDVEELERLVAETRARLLILDPIVAAIDTALDAHKDQHVRSVLARLALLAESADCAVALVGHLNKTPSADPYLRVANSVAFWNASRSVVLITEDEDDTDTRLVAQRKANYSRLRPVERHRIEEIVLPDTLDAETGDLIVTSKMTFVEIADDVESADVLGPRQRTATDSKLLRAALLLHGLLGDGKWHDSAGLKVLAGAQGITRRTLERAAQEIEVEHERRGFPSTTHWRLPSRAGGSPKDVAQLAIPRGYAESEPVAPVAPTNSTGVIPGGTPILGDPDYLTFVAGVHRNGHITTAEALDLERLHNLIEMTRAAEDEEAEH